MNIIKYISTLLPTFGKDRILEDLRLIASELQSLRLAIKEAAKQIPKARGKNHVELARVASNMGFGWKSGSSVFVFLAANLENIIDNIDLMERLVKQELPDTVATKGLDLKQINMLQLAEVCSFVVEFTHFLGVFLTRAEFIEIASDKKLDTDAADLPYEQEIFDAGMLPYLVALKTLTKPVSDTEATLNNIPNVVAAGTDYNTLRATLSQARMDVGALAGQGFEWNPIYHIRMNIVERREARFRQAKSQLACMQLQLQRCRVASTGKNDARLDREIGYLEREVHALSSEIEDLK